MACAFPPETFSEEDEENKSPSGGSGGSFSVVDPIHPQVSTPGTNTSSSSTATTNTTLVVQPPCSSSSGVVPEIKTRSIEKTLIPLVQQVSKEESAFSLFCSFFFLYRKTNLYTI